jgi:tripartite-type tricarboxylate transporter receptor subunit TctC
MCSRAFSASGCRNRSASKSSSTTVRAPSRLGIEIAAKSAPDGYTLLLADMPHTIIPAIQKGVHYDPVRDFTPIGLIGLTEDLKAILDSHEHATRLAPLGVTASHASPAQFRALIESDTARWGDIVKSVGISVP